MNTKKIISSMLCVAIMSMSMLISGCQNGSDEKVSIVIGNWPSETDAATVEYYNEYKRMMNEKYPDIEIVPDTTQISTKEFAAMASSGQLPNLFVSSYTELPLAAQSGFALDITDYCKEYQYTTNLNPLLVDKVSYDERVYGIPSTAYSLGLACNRKMFEAAGLVNEDGSLQYPATYDELAQTAVKIKDATGQAGFSFPTMNNQGGWIFTSLAWSYGVDFMEQDSDGKWQATFDSPECVEALQYIKDLKWKYDVLPDNSFVDVTEQRKLFASDQAAMYLMHVPERMLVKTYSMDKDDICFGRVPAGPEGRYSLMGGNVYMISPNSTPEQVDAVFKWLDIIGESPNVSDYMKENLRLEFEADNNENVPVMKTVPFSIWINDERMQLENELRSEYANVPDVNFSDYSSFEDVIIQEEEPVATQELYSILDAGIQEVLTDENADCEAIVNRMANDFQVNHLDKLS